MEQMRTIIPNGEIHTPYGATEALPVSSIAAAEVFGYGGTYTEGRWHLCGGALPGADVRIIQPVDGPIRSMDDVTFCESGEIGEIIVRGPSVTRAYDAPWEADANSKISDGDTYWHRMGDMGWIGAKDRLWFCGRKAERVLTASGPRYTDCCEAIFNQHPQVFRSALIDLGGGKPGMVIEPEKGAFPEKQAERDLFIDSLQ